MDASVALTIAFDESRSGEVDEIFERLQASKAIVPAIWPVEIANVLAIGERRKRISDGKIRRFIAELDALPIEIDTEGTLAALQRALPLARRLSMSAYDALYLELAQRLRLPLATLDRGLAAGAAKASIELLAT